VLIVRVVIDANELFALLIKGSVSSRSIFTSSDVSLLAPEFLMEEFYNNKDILLSKTHRTPEEFSNLLAVLKEKIRLVPENEFSGFMQAARDLLSGHEKDAAYMALALRFNCPIWSEEKLLKKQDKVVVLNTKELHALLGHQL
jgi:predicted nucleic acid-binding protein